MLIKDLKARTGNCDISAEVVDKGEVREFQKFGKPGRVCSVKIKDSSGQCSLTLWSEQIDQVNVGDKVKVTNGWCSEFQGELQLSTGKFGKLEVEKGSAPKGKPAEKADDEDASEEDNVDEEIVE